MPAFVRVTKGTVAGYLAGGEFGEFEKVIPTRAVRMPGPFVVDTSEGEMWCDDGYLCLDVRGNAYPCAKGVFEQTYQPLPMRSQCVRSV